ncbi:MAG TPA: hypothetical protein VFC09_05425 [Candidatus Dormibacteraeota bacterium]|nr:hypothetical protein [Candidatus Dormibacteraeota bacterium]
MTPVAAGVAPSALPSPAPPAATATGATPSPPAETAQQRGMRRAWVLGAAGVSLIATVQALRDPDVWWHLAVGNLIRAHGIPSHEPFTFLGAPNPWIGQQWGYEVLLSFMFGVGAWLPMLVMGLVASAAFVVAVRSAPRSLRVPGPFLAGGLLLSVVVAGTFVGVRGQVITLLGTAITLWVLARWREGSVRALWALPPLFLLWANLHAGFITGFGVILLVALTVAVWRRIRPGVEPAARLRPLLVAAAIGAIATLLNPAGVHLYPYILDTFTNPTLTSNITEWLPPDFHLTALRIFEIEAVLLVVLWVLSRRPDPIDVVLGIATLAASLQAQRNVAVFAVVAAPQVARYGWLVWISWQQRPRVAAFSRPRPALPALMLAAVVTAAAVVAHVVPISRASAVSQDMAHNWPVAAADYVAAHDAGQRMYSLYEWGGYLADRFPTQRTVYIYGESAVFGSDRLQQYLDIHLVRPDWRSQLEDPRMTVAIVPAASQEATAFLEIGWTTQCHDAASDAVVMHASTLGVGPAHTPPDPRSAPSC